MEKMTDRWEELPPFFITSAENGTGRDDVLDYIESINREISNGQEGNS